MKTKTNKKMSENGYKVGDYLYSSWGYEQTNVNFFKVVGVTATSVKLVPVKGERVDGGRGSYLVPTDEVERYSVFDKDGNLEKRGYLLKRVKRGMLVSVSDYAIAYKWDGRPVAESSWY